MRLFILFLSFTIMMSGLVNATILNQKTEETCNNGVCVRTIYQNDVFTPDLKSFNQLINKANIDENKSIIYEFRDGFYVKFEPLIVSNGIKYYVKDLPQNKRNRLNYGAIINRFRDEAKFNMNLDNAQDLDYIGLKVDTNIPIELIHYNYTKSGIYTDRNPDVYDVYDMVIANKYRISFTDLIEQGYNISFDIPKREIYIDLRNKQGSLTLDPTSTFYSNSNDGHLTHDDSQAGDPCTSASSSTTTNTVSDDNFFVNVFTHSYLSFDTSSIPDDATISSVNLKTYAHSYAKRLGRGSSPNWVVQYKYKKIDYGVLDCSDAFGFTDTATGNLDWAETIGWKTKSVSTSSIDLTGFSSYRLLPGWASLGANEQEIATWRASEYSGTSTDPILEITYTLPAPAPTENPKLIKNNRSIFPLVILVAFMIIASRGVFVVDRREDDEKK